MEVNLETVLAVAVALIVVNLIFIGAYIVAVLKEIKKTFEKAHAIIEDVDRSVKDGIGKVTSMEKPLQAIATTSVALASVIKGSSVVKKATDSILSASHTANVMVTDDDELEVKSKSVRRPRWFKKSNQSTDY